MKTKVRCCPHCKSDKGFSIQYTIHIHGEETRKFDGEVVDVERSESVETDKYGVCINCGHSISKDLLKCDE